MNGLKTLRSFKTVYSENKTYLIFSIRKKEEINYSQVQMLENDSYREYFLPFQCTKTASTNKISFDISGLTSLSEYLKTEMTQEKYFEIISGIQKIISFCHKSYLSYDNLVCNPKYMYYHNTLKKVLMVYIPLKNHHYVCDDIPKCLKQLHKNAKSVIITDGNYMNKYEMYLNLYLNSSKKKGANSFSPDSLLHFFNENEMSGKQNDEIEYAQDSVSVPQKKNYSINSQIVEDIPFKPSESDMLTHTSSATVVRSRRDEVYLTDKDGNRTYISNLPFTIGRNKGKDLVIEQPTVSGEHAVITEENGSYFIKDVSRNGVFLNDEDNRITYSEIKDGDKLYFDSFCYTFSLVKPNDQQNSISSHTVVVSRRRHNDEAPARTEENIPQTASETPKTASEKALAYLRKISDGAVIKIMHYPFSDAAVDGIQITSEAAGNRVSLCIGNISCQSLLFEDTPVEEGGKKEIFSGCTLTINGEKYMFTVEN